MVCVHATSFPSLIRPFLLSIVTGVQGRRDQVRDQVSSGALRVRADLARGFSAAWAVLGPWCEIYLALGLEQGLLVEIRKDLRPEGRLPHHREADHGKTLDLGSGLLCIHIGVAPTQRPDS